MHLRTIHFHSWSVSVIITIAHISTYEFTSDVYDIVFLRQSHRVPQPFSAGGITSLCRHRSFLSVSELPTGREATAVLRTGRLLKNKETDDSWPVWVLTRRLFLLGVGWSFPIFSRIRRKPIKVFFSVCSLFSVWLLPVLSFSSAADGCAGWRAENLPTSTKTTRQCLWVRNSISKWFDRTFLRLVVGPWKIGG